MSAWTGRTLIPYFSSNSSLASVSFLTFLPVITRLAPSLAYAVAIPYPIDPQLPSLKTALPPPVIIAVFPFNVPISLPPTKYVTITLY